MNDFQLTNPENADLCDPALSQWYLDSALAERIAVWAQANHPYPKRMRVLEPSAGRGALAMPLRAFFGQVACVELDVKNAAHLLQLGFEVHHGDFLKWWPDHRFDLTVANPPFENGQTEEHILRALEHCDRVVCHCPLTTLAGQDRRVGLWSVAYLKRLVIHSSRPSYSGTRGGGKTDMCTIDVVRRPELHPVEVSASGVSVEWWS